MAKYSEYERRRNQDPARKAYLQAYRAKQREHLRQQEQQFWDALPSEVKAQRLALRAENARQLRIRKLRRLVKHLQACERRYARQHDHGPEEEL